MGLFSKFSDVSRVRKLELFNDIFCPTEQMHILDVGAEINPDGSRSLQLIDSYPWKDRLSAANISAAHISSIKKYYPEINAIVADACELPWPDKYFDIVYSNAVIEHVGDFERQKQMAAEIMRVGKHWFVSTPNRWYPFEFHLRLPFVTWLPNHAYLSVAKLIRYSHVSKRYTFGNKKADFRLMTARELQSCLPSSRIIKHRVTFMAETLIAVGGDIKI